MMMSLLSWVVLFLVIIVGEQTFVTAGSSSECYRRLDAKDYRGTVSQTVSGNTCQKWSDQSPNKHNKTEENYPECGLGDHNHCRNPDGSGAAWCYTTNDTVDWEYCDNGEPDENCEYSECYYSKYQSDYRGSVSNTKTGKQCQEWRSEYPHQHFFYTEPYARDYRRSRNFCRNLQGDYNKTWCYTVDPETRWEECTISAPEAACPFSDCYYKEDGSDYRGKISRTVSGRPCQKWTEQSPHEHLNTPENKPYSGIGNNNYCRNPNGQKSAWCYTNDPAVRSEECYIGKPNSKQGLTIGVKAHDGS